MNRTAAPLALYLALVFVSGIAVGALGYRYYATQTSSAKTRPRTPEEFRAHYLKDMQTRLKLSSPQLADLEKILDETRNKFREVREKYAPEMKAIQDEQVSRINSILSPEQQAEYAKMRQEREERRKAMEKEGRTPPPPRER
jgi:phosphorylcholine metabolism protein LicD